MLELNLKSGKNEISFKSQGYNLAAHLYVPEDFNAAGRYPAIEGASHLDLYNFEERVNPAVAAVDVFFKKHGGPAV